MPMDKNKVFQSRPYPLAKTVTDTDADADANANKLASEDHLHSETHDDASP